MAVIYLQHFLHGNKVAISEDEATYDERNGWRRYTPGEPVPADDAEPVNALHKRGPGRLRKVVNELGV